jgi:TolB-like protein
LARERVERRLAAILAADIAGYSRLMGRDEERTLANLKSLRKTLIDPAIGAHHGRIVKTTGDGMLVEFASAVDAARCAAEIQSGMTGQNADVSQDVKIEFRIGIHVGDIIIDDNDIFGDGVNIAARLEGLAEPGGICISDDAQRQIRGKVDFAFHDMGPQTLKNIAEPMRAWRMQASKQSVAGSSQPLALPDKPSIAILPFTNMSGDPEQDYFADGMVEDITTALSRSKSLFVIARNSSFTYKGKAVDIKQVGRELGVRYVLEGSVRKSGNRVRITGQLIDAATGNHLWADRFDSQLEEIFDLQDWVTASVVGAISPKLEQAEIERSRRKPTESLQAYDYYFRALACNYQYTRESNIEALKFTQIANEFDPEFAASYALGAGSLMARKAFGWSVDAAQETREAQRLAGRALELAKDDPWVIAVAGQTLSYLVGQIEEGAALLSHAISLDPNLAIARTWNGWTHVFLGDVEAAIEQFQVALRLSPVDPRIFMSQTGMAYAHFLAGRYEDGSSWATIAIRHQPNYLRARHIMMACHAMAGRGKQAQQECELALRIDPTMRISQIKDGGRLRPEDIDKLAAAFRIAGMPE